MGKGSTFEDIRHPSPSTKSQTNLWKKKPFAFDKNNQQIIINRINGFLEAAGYSLIEDIIPQSVVKHTQQNN